MNSTDLHKASPVPVTLWLVDLTQTFTEAQLALYHSWLNPVELSRWQRFHFDRDKQRFLVCRALMREVLGKELNIDPANIEFTSNAWGKPLIRIDGSGKAPVYFNLSHTHGLGVLAVCREADLGVDVENYPRKVEPNKVAERFFSSLECEQLETLTGQHEREVFFAFWTLKEAYIKAVGKGLAIALDSFSFMLDGNGMESTESSERIDIKFSEQHPDDPTQWQFSRYKYGSQHPLALAVKTSAPLKLTSLLGAPAGKFEPLHLPVFTRSKSPA